MRATPQRVWETLSDLEKLRVVLGARLVVRKAGARGGVIGTIYHCHHGPPGHPPTLLRLVSSALPHEVTWLRREVGTYYLTWRTTALDGAATRVEIFVGHDRPKGLRALPRRLLAEFSLRASLRQTLRDLKRLVEAA